jgi:hypothetical protein
VSGTWLQVRVDLVGAGRRANEDPGRIVIVGPRHTFAQLADAINVSFARWDLSHLHEFELAGGRKIGFPDDEYAPELVWEDQAALKVVDEVAPGDEFVFTFDFGANWRHRCRVLEDRVDPREVYGPGRLPTRPVVTWGWGWIPDQYGRRSFDDDGSDEDVDE